jgi:hypothetical protein
MMFVAILMLIAIWLLLTAHAYRAGDPRRR